MKNAREPSDDQLLIRKKRTAFLFREDFAVWTLKKLHTSPDVRNQKTNSDHVSKLSLDWSNLLNPIGANIGSTRKTIMDFIWVKYLRICIACILNKIIFYRGKSILNTCLIYISQRDWMKQTKREKFSLHTLRSHDSWFKEGADRRMGTTLTRS